MICSTQKDTFITGKDGWDKKVKIKGYALYDFATVTTEWHKWIIKMNVMSWCNLLSTQSHIKIYNIAKYKIKICSSLFCVWILPHPYMWIRNRSKFEWKRLQTLVGIPSNFFTNSNTELLTSALNMTTFKVPICVELIHSLLTDANKLNRIQKFKNQTKQKPPSQTWNKKNIFCICLHLKFNCLHLEGSWSHITESNSKKLCQPLT